MRGEDLPKIPEEAYGFPKTHDLAEVRELVDALGTSEHEQLTVAIAGRIASRRDMGKLQFDTVVDQTGQIQVLSQVSATKDYEALKGCNVGDWVGFVGAAGRSKKGEPTVFVDDWSYLAKTEKSFPSFHSGISDEETRSRQRYVDLTVNRDSLQRFQQRSRMLHGIRGYMEEGGFMEVETPTLQPVAGGASARPFTTHHNTLDMELNLRIAPELYLKRLVVGGLERVYEIGKSFRNEGISPRHNPEFTMMEVYAAYWDADDQMAFTEGLVEEATRAAHGTTVLEYQGRELDLKAPWRRVGMTVLASEAVGEEIDITTDKRKLQAICDSLKIPYNDKFGPGRLVAEIYEETTEKDLFDPTFVIDYPTEISPLAREHRRKPGYTERFEGVVAGRELCNGYSELNNADIQRERFVQQEGEREHDDEAMSFDQDYIDALRYGLPPTGGMGIGIDRLAMILTNTKSIRDVILFPTLRPASNGNETKG